MGEGGWPHIEMTIIPVATAEKNPSDRDTGREGNRVADRAATIPIGGWISITRVIPAEGSPGRTVNDHGIVNRHINDLWIGGPDEDRFLLDDDRLLIGGGKIPLRAGAIPHALDGFHHVVLLAEHGIAEILRPVEIVVEQGEGFREGNEGFDTRLPRLRLHGLVESGSAESLVFLAPAAGLDDLQGIGGRHHGLREQIIGIERDRCDQLLQLIR